MSKVVTHGVYGFARALFYDGSVYQPEDNAFVQTEGPTAYMPSNFSSFYSIDTTTGNTTLITHSDSSSGTTSLPLVRTLQCTRCTC